MSPRTGSRNSGKNVISTPFEKAPRTAPRCPPAPFPITPAASFTEQVRETFAGRVTGFYRQQSILGHDITTQVLRNGIAVNAEAAQALQLDPTDELIVLERLRYVNGALHQHVETYLPASKYPGVLPELDHFSYPWLFPRLLRSSCVWALILGVAVICWPLISMVTSRKGRRVCTSFFKVVPVAA